MKIVDMVGNSPEAAQELLATLCLARDDHGKKRVALNALEVFAKHLALSVLAGDAELSDRTKRELSVNPVLAITALEGAAAAEMLKSARPLMPQDMSNEVLKRAKMILNDGGIRRSDIEILMRIHKKPMSERALAVIGSRPPKI